jgi:hypothetical protein
MKKKNTNILTGMKCPMCDSLSPFRIDILQAVIVHDDGCDLPEGDNQWTDSNFCMCTECDYEGTVADFQIKKSSQR